MDSRDYFVGSSGSVVAKYFVYILRCSDDSLYTGWTTNIAARVEQHNAKKGAKYTRSRTPVTCVYSELFDSREEAMKREYEIKQLTRQEKTLLIAPQTV